MQLLVEALPPAVWMAVELLVVVAPEERASATPCGRTGRGGSGADGGGARIRDAVREEGAEAAVPRERRRSARICGAVREEELEAACGDPCRRVRSPTAASSPPPSAAARGRHRHASPPCRYTWEFPDPVQPVLIWSSAVGTGRSSQTSAVEREGEERDVRRREGDGIQMGRPRKQTVTFMSYGIFKHTVTSLG